MPSISGALASLAFGVALVSLASLGHAQTLRGHWAFDDGSGMTAADSSGFGHHGALLGGPLWTTTGQVDGALDFDGSNDRVTVPPGPLAMDIWPGLTISAWVRNDVGAGGGTNDIAGQWNFPASKAWILTHHSNNQYFFEIAGKGAISGGTVSTAWTHVAATYDGAAMRLYVNGAQVTSQSGLSGTIPASNADFLIGGQADGSNYFDGEIDEARLYDDALTDAQILALYNAGFDTTPPTSPTGLATTAIGITTVDLIWSPSSDPESGVDHYNVYRDSLKVGESTNTSYADSNLAGGTSYTYNVSAVNGQALESSLSASLLVTTAADTAPPGIISVEGTPDQVVVLFDEDVDAITAASSANYSIDLGITVMTATLAGDNRTVTLDTSPHSMGQSYMLTVDAVEDLAGNAIPSTMVAYTPQFSDPDLRGHWTFDEMSGTVATDSSLEQNNGSLLDGAQFEQGLFDGAVRLDGSNDRISVDPTGLEMHTWSEFTAMAWIRHDVGATGTTNDILGVWNYPASKSWILTHHGNDQYFFEIAGKGVATGGTVSTAWTHVAGTYDGSAMRLYVDGVEVASDSGLSGPLEMSFASLVIGAQDDNRQHFDGLIDDTRIYSRALSPAEIGAVFSGDSPVIASATPVAGTAPLLVQFMADDPSGNIVSYAWDFGDGGASSLQNPTYIYNSPGAFTAIVVATNGEGSTSQDSIQVVVSGLPPSIDVWYGLLQEFSLGTPQTWVNILGGTSPGLGLSSLTASVNGGAARTLSVGSDLRRLYNSGDFNVDIPIYELLDGPNMVELVATDVGGAVALETLVFDYDSATVWPLPFNVDWSGVTHIQEAVQVVDGKWQISASGVRVMEPGYDRVISIGDLTWDDYEITVPFTINGFESGDLGPVSVNAGFGMTFRWSGHTDDPVFCAQPSCGWLPSGAGAWYDIGGSRDLLLDGMSDSSLSINVGDTVIWKFRVESIPGVGPLYSVKVWHQGNSEPAAWALQTQHDLTTAPSGSLILNLHHVDATIGNISVISTSAPDTTPPTVTAVTALTATTVLVAFSESVTAVTAENITSYFIDNGISVLGASLAGDQRTVTLTTTAHSQGINYTIDVAGVRDLAMNVMVPAMIAYGFAPASPVASYPFDEGSGTFTGDASGNGHDGMLVGGAAFFEDTERGTTLSLDGADDEVQINAGPLGMDTWTAFSASVWVKNDIGFGAGTQDILSWWNWTGWPCGDCSLVLTHHSNNQYFFQLGSAWLTGGTVSADWTHVVTTWDGSTLRLYVDAVEVASAPFSGAMPTSNAPLIVGGQDDPTNAFDGLIDDLLIFDEALSSQDVLDLYNN